MICYFVSFSFPSCSLFDHWDLSSQPYARLLLANGNAAFHQLGKTSLRFLYTLLIFVVS